MIRPGPARPRRASGWLGWPLAAAAMTVDLVFWGGGTATRFGGSIPPAVVYLAAALMCLGLTQASGVPQRVFSWAWCYSVGFGLLLPTYEPFTALLVATYFITRQRPLPVARWYVLATVVPWTVNTLNAIALSHPGAIGSVVIAATWCLITALVWMAGLFAFRTAELGKARAEIHRVELTATVQAERVRMARELHDIVAHSVSAIVLQSAGAQRVIRTDDPVAAGALRTIETTSTRAMRELRRLLGVLVDDAGEPEAYARLDELDAVVEATAGCGIAVRCHQSGERRPIPRAFEHAVYRTVQEALANVIRHGGPGSSAEIDLGWQATRLDVTVRSHSGGGGGVRAADRGSGLGLNGLAQRLADLGGACSWRREGEDRFRLDAWLPVPDASGDVPQRT